MATKAKTQAAIQPVVNGTNGNGHTELFKFTWNVRSETESLTVRSNDEAEIEAARSKWKETLHPPRQRKPRLKEGDPCGADDCHGYMTLQKGTNRRTGHQFEFLGCSVYPDCSFTAYVAEEQAEGT